MGCFRLTLVFFHGYGKWPMEIEDLWWIIYTVQLFKIVNFQFRLNKQRAPNTNGDVCRQTWWYHWIGCRRVTWDEWSMVMHPSMNGMPLFSWVYKSLVTDWDNFKVSWFYMGVSENSVSLNPMVLLIIIPMKNGYFIGNINPTFSDKPTWFHLARFSPYGLLQICSVKASTIRAHL